MEKELKTVRYQSEKHKKVTSLMHRVNTRSLYEAHKKQKAGKAVGIDGETKQSYGEHIDRNLEDLSGKNEEISIHTKASQADVYTEGKWETKAARYTVL